MKKSIHMKIKAQRWNEGTSGLLISSFRIEWRVNLSSLKSTAIWAGAVNFNHPSIMTIPLCSNKKHETTRTRVKGYFNFWMILKVNLVTQ